MIALNKKILIFSIVAFILFMSTTSTAEALIKEFEGKKLRAYLDSAGIPTIGYGSIFNPDLNRPVKLGDQIDDATALRWLRSEINAKETAIKRMITVPVTRKQLDALTSLAYNIGTGAFQRSTLLRYLNSNKPKITVANQFLVWNKVTKNGVKVVEPGLSRRRALERALFLS